ncbi:MAG: hypothetical protein NTY53_13485 [Kiritimatiellaeota bacterium]|nr:hypothetical protein [Kiritimatiellota bacterium]
MNNTHSLLTTLPLASLAVMAIGLGSVSAAKKTEPAIVLAKYGERLEAKYAEQLKTLQAEITKALPAVAEHKKAALQKAQEATIAELKPALEKAQGGGKKRSAADAGKGPAGAEPRQP